MVIIIQQVQGKTVFFNYRKHLLCIQTVFCPLHNPYYLTELVHTASIYSISLNYVLLQDGVCPLSKLDTPCGFYTISNGDNQLNPARGRKLCGMPGTHVWRLHGFMQLNSARGRKLVWRLMASSSLRRAGLCSSTPRGDGNSSATMTRSMVTSHGLCSYNPARGRKHQRNRLASTRHEMGLCSSTPRGDGNYLHKEIKNIRDKVYTAQPREGTETRWVLEMLGNNGRFMQLNPARGRKRAHAPLSGHGAALDPHAHDDTPPCSSPVSAPHAQHISSFLMGGLW